MNVFRKVWMDDEGQDLIEYALIGGLVALACVAAITAVGGSLKTVWGNIQTQLAAVPSGT